MKCTQVQVLAITYLLVMPAIASMGAITGTYVDADLSNTTSATVDWLEIRTTRDGTNNQWSYCSQVQKVEGTNAFVSFVPNENCPKLTTTVSNLPLATYDIYAVYWVFPAGKQWRIQAGLNDQSMQLCDWSTGIKCRDDGFYQERQVRLGRIYDATSFSVDIDDAPGLMGDQRALYDGVTYVNVSGIPGSIAGTIAQPGFDGDTSKWPIYIDLLKNEQIAMSTVIFPDAAGAFMLDGISPGKYQIAFQACKALRRVVNVTVNPEETSQLAVSLENGDLDGDNTIGSSDLSTMGLNLGKDGD